MASIESRLEPCPRRLEGISPHAPHTVSPTLLEGVARVARRRSLPVQVHWSETREELEWLQHGVGPFADLLSKSPRLGGLELLDRAGLLNSSLSLVHGNWPADDEPALLASRGVTVVHCPGSHAFFERPPFPLEAYRAAGVVLALGTDSLASNRTLDMRRELGLLRSTARELEPEEVWCMATLGGARALGLAGEVGELAAGARADFVLFEQDPVGRKAVLEGLSSGASGVLGVWIDGVSALDELDSGTPPPGGFGAGDRP